MMNYAAVVYMSPAGSTGSVAATIVATLKQHGIEVAEIDLGTPRDSNSKVIKRLAHQNTCLFIGSPVYVNRPVSPIMSFIESLDENHNGYTVPFVTWGGASSGIALLDMGQSLEKKGYKVIGAAKVLAPHSMMWQSTSPLGLNHPDAQEIQMIKDLVTGIINKFSTQHTLGGDLLEALAYQPKLLFEEMKNSSLAKAKSHMPEKKIDEQRCIQCGQCAELCPVQAIVLNPFPVFNDDCICCYKCVRECPEDAFVVDLTMIEARIKERSQKINEQPKTAIFL